MCGFGHRSAGSQSCGTASAASWWPASPRGQPMPKPPSITATKTHATCFTRSLKCAQASRDLKKGNVKPLSSGIHIGAKRLQFLKPSTKTNKKKPGAFTVAVFRNYAKNSHRPLCQKGLINRFKKPKQLKIQNKLNCVRRHTTIKG